VYPPVIIWDATASKLFLVVEVRRQYYCLGLRLCFAASHAASVAGVSSVTPGVANGTADEKATGNVKERQAASLGLRSHDGNYLCDTLWLLALVWPPLIHFRSLCAAGAGRRWRDAEPLQ
jgi:hypothetical protein